MPLLMCPNCQIGMKEITRESVLIDICPTCQGVWLDRGELNKLLTLNREEEPSYNSQPHHRLKEEYHGHKYKKKSKLESVFDIFDL